MITSLGPKSRAGDANEAKEQSVMQLQQTMKHHVIEVKSLLMECSKNSEAVADGVREHVQVRREEETSKFKQVNLGNGHRPSRT